MIGRRLKLYFLIMLIGSLAVAFIGYVYTARDLPPYPGTVISEDGRILTTGERILGGQGVWQKYGLMDLGSVWGHGTYRGPDFTAQALHLMGESMREEMARATFGTPYGQLDVPSRGAADAVAIEQIKTNRYARDVDRLVLSPLQEAALMENRRFYDALFSKGDPRGPIQPDTIRSAEERRDLADFFFWTAWVAGTLRPGDTHTYTNNWPNDASVGNSVSGMSLVWSGISIVAFGVLLGVMVFLYHRYRFNEGALPYNPEFAQNLMAGAISASQRKTAKFFLVVTALFFLQVNLGGFMAHQTVNSGSFYGLDWVNRFFNYNWMKSWHLQLAVFWIATSWIGTTLFLSPRVGGKEPGGQGLLVDVLFVAVLVVAVGSLTGEGHHYYWFGEPSFWLALGSTISALEPVPILLLLAEVWHGQRALLKAGSSFPYRYPLMFLMAAVAWEFLGAGVIGLSITTPVVNYFEHSTYLTVNHGHTALFGTYGMLAIGLLLFSMRGIVREDGWDERLVKLSFWGINVGLLVMWIGTLLPIGSLQVLDNIENGFWHARSNAFWEQPAVQFLGEARIVPDFLIILGSLCLLLFMLKAILRLKPATVPSGGVF